MDKRWDLDKRVIKMQQTHHDSFFIVYNIEIRKVNIFGDETLIRNKCTLYNIYGKKIIYILFSEH